MTNESDISTNFKRIPNHIGIIPDGNRRWALNNNLEKKDGYAHGIIPGYNLCEQLIKFGVKEATFYGFTKDNNNRPSEQTKAYVKACIEAVEILANKDVNIMVIGKTDSKVFPKELLPYANKRVNFGKGLINVNYLINYDWNWDLMQGIKNTDSDSKNILDRIASKDISRIDMIIRWGGRTRLSGFLPAQSVYSDFYVIDDYWPDYKDSHFLDAMNWYQTCDVTLGG